MPVRHKKGSKKQALSIMQRRFVDEYVSMNRPSATKAARLAGYTAHSAQEANQEILQKPHVKEAIELRMLERQKRLDIKADDIVLGILESIGDAKAKGDDRTAMRGYELLGKHLKMFTDVTETKHTFSQMGKVVIGHGVQGENGAKEAVFLSFDVGEPPKEVIE